MNNTTTQSITEVIAAISQLLTEMQTIREEVQALETKYESKVLQDLKTDISKRVRQNIYIDSEDLIEVDMDYNRSTLSASFGIDEGKLMDLIESEIEDAFDDLIREAHEKSKSVTDED
jgi:MinD-like ATPase involved in chromosome partitioning or flagellar assembly